MYRQTFRAGNWSQFDLQNFLGISLWRDLVTNNVSRKSPSFKVWSKRAPNICWGRLQLINLIIFLVNFVTLNSRRDSTTNWKRIFEAKSPVHVSNGKQKESIFKVTATFVSEIAWHSALLKLKQNSFFRCVDFRTPSFWSEASKQLWGFFHRRAFTDVSEQNRKSVKRTTDGERKTRKA